MYGFELSFQDHFCFTMMCIYDPCGGCALHCIHVEVREQLWIWVCPTFTAILLAQHYFRFSPLPSSTGGGMECRASSHMISMQLYYWAIFTTLFRFLDTGCLCVAVWNSLHLSGQELRDPSDYPPSWDQRCAPTLTILFLRDNLNLLPFICLWFWTVCIFRNKDSLICSFSYPETHRPSCSWTPRGLTCPCLCLCVLSHVLLHLAYICTF